MCCTSSTSPQNWTCVYSYHLVVSTLAGEPFGYVCVSPLEYAYCFSLMRFPLARQICGMTFRVWYGPLDHVGRVSTPMRMGYYCGASCKPRTVQMSGQEARSLVIFWHILWCSIPSCLSIFLPFSWSIQTCYDACVSVSPSGIASWGY